MRAGRLAVAVSALGVIAGMALVAPPGAVAQSSSGSGGSKHVRVLDDCDPATFNAAIGPGTCVGKGDTTFNDFVGQLVGTGAAKKWAFKPATFHVNAGRTLDVENRGGEFHTFTQVANFGGGCVGLLNDLLGLTPVPECDGILVTPGGPPPPAFIATGVNPGGTLDVAALAPGTYKFQCLVHPWMHSVLTVRSHH